MAAEAFRNCRAGVVAAGCSKFEQAHSSVPTVQEAIYRNTDRVQNNNILLTPQKGMTTLTLVSYVFMNKPKHNWMKFIGRNINRADWYSGLTNIFVGLTMAPPVPPKLGTNGCWDDEQIRVPNIYAYPRRSSPADGRLWRIGLAQRRRYGCGSIGSTLAISVPPRHYGSVVDTSYV